ncbi:alpha/beta hydrolase family protein [Sphingobium ummariense]|uniref:Alpha/beta hydrolase n=1 Tax=Sphingobium ummariense RL-3 TaxID=1346791 RepID=T0IY60_9SPHN|nr:alpha/beta fold hydrolase [Sphingobium ummariense]EQB30656.1 alpha/beta hydrolase [Sphingobium ummariense RL-3]
MRKLHIPVSLAMALACLPSASAKEPPIHPAVIADPAPDAANPPGMSAFVIPAQDGAMNAVMYTAAGAGRHPTLLLLHGFPGNEQNLDLAQAARRAGWNVLTLHYRGSWGSPGTFSFTHAAEDAWTALLFLEEPSTAAKYRIDPSAIVVAGHSMGGFMAADAAASEPRVAGLFLIDPWDPSQTVASLATPQGEAGWKAEVAGDLPPLNGATYESLTEEIKAGTEKFDLGRRLAGYGRRPVMIVGAERGIGAMARKVAADAQAVNPDARLMVWPTDHSFSDKRIALADALVRFLAVVAPTIR